MNTSDLLPLSPAERLGHLFAAVALRARRPAVQSAAPSSALDSGAACPESVCGSSSRWVVPGAPVSLGTPAEVVTVTSAGSGELVVSASASEPSPISMAPLARRGRRTHRTLTKDRAHVQAHPARAAQAAEQS